jgi:hypothetical protein
MTLGVRGRLKCREQDLFGPSLNGTVEKIAVKESAVWKIIIRLLNHFIIEFLASVILMYSSVYVPEDGADFMKQYVSSLSIFVVILVIKDKAYFCPDGTPMTTAVLAASGAYTDKNKKTDWVDICVRVAGQLIGWAVVCFVIVGTNKPLFAYSSLAYKHQDAELGLWFMVFNEFVSTFLECVSISFMIMPLLNSYAIVDNSDGFQSKQEAMPPNNIDLGFASAALAVLHYVLERLFRTTMNPFVFVMHCYITNCEFNSTTLTGAIVMVQVLSLGFACTYCYFQLPSQRVFDHIRSTSAGKPA